MRGRTARRTARRILARALAQRLHQVDDLGRLALLRLLDRLAILLALDQVAQRALVMVLEFVRLEVPGLTLNDVRRQLELVLRLGLVLFVL